MLAWNPPAADAALVDFTNGTWNHGSGNVTGWQQPTLDTSPYTGTTTLSNGIQATFTIRDIGDVFHTNPNTSQHMTNRSYTNGGTGLYLTQSSGSAFNGRRSSLSDYLRIDVALSVASYVEFFVHDIDISDENWDDAVYVESFSSGFGAVGSGTRANYASLGTDLTTETLHSQGLLSIRPDDNSGNPPSSLILAADLLTSNSAQINFATDVRYFSFYYWNRDFEASDGDNQLIHLSGISAFNASEVPEPSTWAFLSITGFAAFCRKRRQAKRDSSTVL
jgi:hypothetical protein